MGPTVSIGLPVFNGGQFVDQAINSLTRQTCDDWELLISDNGSNDETEFICRKWATTTSKIQYYRHQRNHGAVWNFRSVLARAKGEYFMWAAADDLWAPSYVERCIRGLRNNADAGFAITRWKVCSRTAATLNRQCVPGLPIVALNDPLARVQQYSRIPFLTHKDNLIYGLWRRCAITNVVNRTESIGAEQVGIGGAMNELALYMYRGVFIDEVLFFKMYPLWTPGHWIHRVALRCLRFRDTFKRDCRRKRKIVSEIENQIVGLTSVLNQLPMSSEERCDLIGVNRRNLLREFY